MTSYLLLDAQYPKFAHFANHRDENYINRRIKSLIGILNVYWGHFDSAAQIVVA